MDALAVLREMHVEAKSTFEQIERASPEQRGALWAKLRPELKAHEQVEELFVYDPVVRDLDGQDSVLSAWEQEHHHQVDEMEALMSELGRLEPRDEQWMEKFRALRQMMDNHIRQEETEIWPRIRSVWGPDKLEQVGGQVQAAKAATGAGARVSGAVGAAGEAIKGAANRVTGR
jgi:hypothetical protein